MQDCALFGAVLTSIAAGLDSLFDSQQENYILHYSTFAPLHVGAPCLQRTLWHVPPVTALLHRSVPTLLPLPFWKEDTVFPFSVFHLKTKLQTFCCKGVECRIAGWLMRILWEALDVIKHDAFTGFYLLFFPSPTQELPSFHKVQEKNTLLGTDRKGVILIVQPLCGSAPLCRLRALCISTSVGLVFARGCSTDLSGEHEPFWTPKRNPKAK